MDNSKPQNKTIRKHAKIHAYLIPEKLTALSFVTDRYEHTWIGEPQQNGDYIFVLTSTKFNKQHEDEYTPWFKKEDGTVVYIKQFSCFLMQKERFNSYCRDTRQIKEQKLDQRNYIRVNWTDTNHINDLPLEQWHYIFDLAYRQINDEVTIEKQIKIAKEPTKEISVSAKKKLSSGAIIAIVFGLLAFVGLIIGIVMAVK